MSPLFSRKPKLDTCFMCSELIEPSDKLRHYETHLLAVTDDNGDSAYTFKCPKCGLMDSAWGAGARTDAMARSKAASAVGVHLMTSHHIPLH